MRKLLGPAYCNYCGKPDPDQRLRIRFCGLWLFHTACLRRLLSQSVIITPTTAIPSQYP
jgi:hypothetical protein